MTRPAYGGRAHADVPSPPGALSEHRTMTDVAYDQLKAAIVELRIPPGERLREAALARLEQDGLVELSSFKSAGVTRYTAQGLREIYELREIIEVATARSAAESMTDKGLADLGRIARECVRLNDEVGGPELVRLISEFDTVLFGEVSNHRIRSILDNLADHLTRIGLLAGEIPGRNAASVREHAQIYEAIECRDLEAAEKFMREHIRSVRDNQLRALPGSGSPP